MLVDGDGRNRSVRQDMEAKVDSFSMWNEEEVRTRHCHHQLQLYHLLKLESPNTDHRQIDFCVEEVCRLIKY